MDFKLPSHEMIFISANHMAEWMTGVLQYGPKAQCEIHHS